MEVTQPEKNEPWSEVNTIVDPIQERGEVTKALLTNSSKKKLRIRRSLRCHSHLDSRAHPAAGLAVVAAVAIVAPAVTATAEPAAIDTAAAVIAAVVEPVAAGAVAAVESVAAAVVVATSLDSYLQRRVAPAAANSAPPYYSRRSLRRSSLELERESNHSEELD